MNELIRNLNMTVSRELTRQLLLMVDWALLVGLDLAFEMRVGSTVGTEVDLTLERVVDLTPETEVHLRLEEKVDTPLSVGLDSPFGRTVCSTMKVDWTLQPDGNLHHVELNLTLEEELDWISETVVD